LVDHYSFFVERAVMAPDIAKVDANRHLHLGLSAWNFCDEVLRCFFMGNSFSDPEDLLIPFLVNLTPNRPSSGLSVNRPLSSAGDRTPTGEPPAVHCSCGEISL
jgi:hypothetical protein